MLQAPPRHISRRISLKQKQALIYLNDKETDELLFGGGASGGKSKLGCMFITDICMKYNGIRVGICRKELKRLKETTLLTLFDQFRDDGLKEGVDYIYNQQNGTIIFTQSKSVIFLIELDHYPSDPNYDRLGSYELTFNFIDEAQQITQKAKDVMRSRLRYKIEEYGLIPKQLLSCNPSKGYLYSEYYLPNKKGELPKHKKFLVALASDNPFNSKAYIESLKKQPLEIRERLLYGNWEYDDDPTKMMTIDSINDLFTNKVPSGPQKYIICDAARMGSDRITISYWEGLRCKRMAAFRKLPLVPDVNDPTKPSTAGIITEWMEMYGVPLSHVLVDEDGMGGGIKDHLGCKGFLNGSKPFRGENYTNLKTQCAYLLAKKVGLAEIAIETENFKIRSLIVEELEQLKQVPGEGKLAIIKKDDMKERLGRSPDFLDNLLMRMYFEFAPKPSLTFL